MEAGGRGNSQSQPFCQRRSYRRSHQRPQQQHAQRFWFYERGICTGIWECTFRRIWHETKKGKLRWEWIYSGLKHPGDRPGSRRPAQSERRIVHRQLSIFVPGLAGQGRSVWFWGSPPVPGPYIQYLFVLKQATLLISFRTGRYQQHFHGRWGWWYGRES